MAEANAPHDPEMLAEIEGYLDQARLERKVHPVAEALISALLAEHAFHNLPEEVKQLAGCTTEVLLRLAPHNMPLVATEHIYAMMNMFMAGWLAAERKANLFPKETRT